MAFKMKYKNLEEVVKQLNSAVVAHGKQAKTIEKHIDGQNVSKDAYIKYENKPGGDEPGKQTNDPDAYDRKANNHGRGPKTN